MRYKNISAQKLDSYFPTEMIINVPKQYLGLKDNQNKKDLFVSEWAEKHFPNRRQAGEEKKKNETDFLYLSHVGTDGSTLKIRLEEKDYQVVYCVENIAHLKGNESMVIDHWMNSPTACNNIMNRQVTAMGMARSGDFWVVLLAQPTKK